MDIEKQSKNLPKNPKDEEEIEYLSDSEQSGENNPEEKVESDSEGSIPDEILQEKIDTIMKRLEQLDVDKEIGEKEKRKDTRIIIDKIVLENFKSYAGVREIGPLHYRFNSVVGPKEPKKCV